MSNTTNRSDKAGISRSCILVTIHLVAAIVCVPLFIIEAYGLAIFIAVTVVLIWVGIAIGKCHKKNRADWMPTDNCSPPRDQLPMYNISASVPPAPPARRMQRASEPTPPATTPGDPTSQLQLSLSSRLNLRYLNHHDGFSSPIIAPHTATPFTANVQPPAYLTVVEDDPGLAPAHHTTPATNEGPARVFEPSNDGLPSYEVAMSTRQPPAYEAPRTARDDGPMTND